MNIFKLDQLRLDSFKIIRKYCILNSVVVWLQVSPAFLTSVKTEKSTQSEIMTFFQNQSWFDKKNEYGLDQSPKQNQSNT